MAWMHAIFAVFCHACQTVIAAGDPVRAGDLTPVFWCVSCAKARLHEDVPTDIPRPAVKPGKLAMPAIFARFSKQDTGAQLKRNILNWRRDGKAEATGDSE